ncbi:receptor-type tyrosine-protein phosphatase F-like [Pollicipes pollicipes]|uniref:receptor-type tyrosine-protein phosphatase F-like n=1 Tax=Pollicipes pollicipes TaxID=41117 RepID=UPI0018857F65|nr:receptor-type tyrosine-protein phosphatase F-like [Pollicipes pollicipes]
MLAKLRYLPSICAVYQPGPCHWINMTWIADTEYRFDRLEPFTWYNVTVFVRAEGRDAAFPASQYISVQTLSARPTPPWQMTATQLNHNSVRVSWQPPKHMNGRLLNYRLSMVPPQPAHVFHTRHTNFTVVEDFLPGANYTFFVQAENAEFLSESSHPASLVFDGDAVIGAVTGVAVEERTPRSLTLSWDALPAADGFLVRYTPTENQLVPADDLRTKNNRVVLSGLLSSGTAYELTVQGYKGRFTGPVQAISSGTTGQPVPAGHESHGDAVATQRHARQP